MQQTIQHLEDIINKYARQLRALDEAAFSFKPSPTKWSGKELIGHLIDSAQSNIRRFIMAQYEERPYIVYEQDTWVKAANYQDYPTADLVDLWVLLNKHIVILLKNLPAGAEKKEVMTQAVHTVEWLAADYNKHLLHHLHQVLKLEPVEYP
jgi:hypothetical protein